MTDTLCNDLALYDGCLIVSIKKKNTHKNILFFFFTSEEVIKTEFILIVEKLAQGFAVYPFIHFLLLFPL